MLRGEDDLAMSPIGALYDDDDDEEDAAAMLYDDALMYSAIGRGGGAARSATVKEPSVGADNFRRYRP